MVCAIKCFSLTTNPLVLDSLRLAFRKRFNVRTALGPEHGVYILQTEGPFAVVVSDLKMLGMDGVTFLSEVKALSPNTTRIMLTGHADLDTALEALNQGLVFRFLTKPCPTDVIAKAVESGLEHYRLRIAETAQKRNGNGPSTQCLT